MYKLLILVGVLSTLNFHALSQSTDDYNKNEVFVGYVHQRITSGGSFNGVEGSYTRNLSRFIGVKGDVSATFRKLDETIPVGSGSLSIKENLSIYQFLGGVQIKNNAQGKRLKPFAHALFGVDHVRDKVSISCMNCGPGADPANDTLKQTGFSGAFGGGLDIKLNKKMDLRAIQADYRPFFAGGERTDSVQFSIGIVFK